MKSGIESIRRVNDIDEKKILVTGSTGYIGRRLVQHLIETDKYDIRLFVRNSHKVQQSTADMVDICEGDTFDMTAMAAALHGVHTAYYLIHSMGSTADYAKLDRESAENFREACIAANVQRIIYLGGLGVKATASEHLLSRIETGEILSSRPDHIQTICLRAGVIIGSGSASFEIIRNLCQKLPVMITPRWVRTLTQPIGVDDVLAYLHGSIELEHAENITIDIGTERLSFQQMMQQGAKAMGLKRWLFPVPVLSPRLSSYWLILFTPIPYKLASALVEGLKSETVAQNDNARKYFPNITPQTFSSSVTSALRELEHNHVVSRWCDSSANKACDIGDFEAPNGSLFRDVRVVPFTSNPTDIFRSVCTIGGINGWFKYHLLWKIRGVMDKVVGGYGLSRGRRSHTLLRTGDALDFWKVADLQEGKRLLLFAQMKLPGNAWLEFDVQHNQLVQTAHFIPKGLLGRLYWYILIPLHYFVFTNLANTIVRRGSERKTAA